MIKWYQWVPGGILIAGCLINTTLVGRKIEPVPLRAPISTVAPTILGVKGIDGEFTPETVEATGMSSYLYRRFVIPGRPEFSLYVGYYDEQRQGKTIHSPKNCLPGSGWESVESKPTTFETAAGPITVNRYRVARPGESAVVYYWYQGRGRVAYDELRVKYQLLRDAALRGRTEEALVRIIIKVANDKVEPADAVVTEIISGLVSQVNQVLPVY